MGRTGTMNSKDRVTKSRQNFSQQTHLIQLDPKLLFCCFRSVWVHLGPFCYCMKIGAKWAKLVQLMQEFVPRSRVRIFRTNTPDPPYWTLNSCLVAFRSVWVHRGPFHNCMKLDAKWPKLVQLMQKFFSQRRVGIFRNERTRSNS